MNRPKSSHPIYLIFLLSIVFSGFYSCRASKDVAKKPTENEVKHLEQLMPNKDDFNSLDSKVEFKFIPKEGVSAGMKGTLRMKRDSCIILSVQPFAGIEAVKCLIRKDSFFIVSRLHKTYAVEDLSQMKNAKYLNMELLQALLSNKIFIPGVTQPTEKELNQFEWHQVKDGNYFRWPDENFMLDFCINEDGEYSELKASNPEKQEKIKVTYNLFERRGALLFPNQVLFSVEGLKQTLKLQITYLKTDFNTPTNFRFEIPAKYKKVTTDELIKRFQSML